MQKGSAEPHEYSKMEDFCKFYKTTDYEISRNGVVVNTRNKKEIQPFLNKSGYPVVNLWQDRNNTIIAVHRLVAETFIENPLNLREVNHKDGVKTNNSVTNLEWVTSSENKQHGIKTGLYSIGEEAHQARLTESDALEIIQRLESGATNHELALLYNVSDGTISEIRLNRTWKHIIREAMSLSGPNPIKKLCGDNIPTIRRMFEQGFSDADIGREYKVARATINQIRQGKTWKNY